MKFRDEGYSPSLRSIIDRDEGYSPSPGSDIDRDKGYSPSHNSVIYRYEGYSPSPDSVIDRDEGYSPYPDSVSISCNQNSLSFPILPRTQELRLLSLHSSQVFLYQPRIPFFPSLERLRVARIPSLWPGLEDLQMGSLHHPLINS
jgi:hypothetical protein